MPRRKVTSLSKQDSSSGSDDDVVYAGTSSPPWREVIELNDSSSSSESSDDGVTYKKQPSSTTKQAETDKKGGAQKISSAPQIMKEASRVKKRKGEVNHDENAEGKRQKSSPMMGTSVHSMRQDKKMKSKEPTQIRSWTGYDDIDVLSNNLKRKSLTEHFKLFLSTLTDFWLSNNHRCLAQDEYATRNSR